VVQWYYGTSPSIFSNFSMGEFFANTHQCHSQCQFTEHWSDRSTFHIK
jgi:hypothetical protein